MKKRAFMMKVLFVLLSLSVLSSCGKGCGKGGGGGAQIDPLDLIPANNNFLIAVNWKKLAGLPFFGDISKDMPAEAKQLSSDVQSVLIALSIRGPSEPPSGLAFVTGNLDEKKVLPLLEDAAKKNGGGELKKETVEGKTVYVSPKDPNIGLVLLSPNQAVWGQMANVKEALGMMTKKGNSIRSNKELIDLFNGRDQKKLLWGGGIIPQGAIPASPTPGQPGDPMAAIQGLKAFSLGIDYDKELTIDWVGQAQDAAQAQNLANLINSYKSIFGATLAAQQPMWGQVIQGSQISNQDKSIKISLKLGEDLVKQLSQQIAQKNKDKMGAAPEAPGLPGVAPTEPMPPPMPPVTGGQAGQPTQPN